MPEKIIPTPGRVVWYFTNGGEYGNFCTAPSGAPLPALVCCVHNNETVNLAVFDANGSPFSRTSVPLIQEGEKVPGAGLPYCGWMPYQQKQAEKQAAIDKLLIEGKTSAPEPDKAVVPVKK